MIPTEPKGPNWDQLYETAANQAGYVTTQQAADAGYSTQLLRKHVHAGRVKRLQRGIYRLVHLPVGEHEELVKAWLQSVRARMVSHATRRRASSRGHHTWERSWFGRVPKTSAARTLNDCAKGGMLPDLLRQATQ